MNLSAIKISPKPTAQRAAEETAQRNVSAGHGALLFRDTAPVVAAVAKALAAAPVKPVSSANGDLVAAMKALVAPVTAALEKANARLAAPVTKAAPVAPPAPTPVLRSTGNPPSVPLQTATQLNRQADAREEARKAAARDDADRVLVKKAGPRVLTFRKLDATLSDVALRALTHIVGAWEAAERRPVRMYPADLSRALDISLASATAALAELNDKRMVISATNSAGTALVMPGLSVTGA